MITLRNPACSRDTGCICRRNKKDRPKALRILDIQSRNSVFMGRLFLKDLASTVLLLRCRSVAAWRAWKSNPLTSSGRQ